MAFTEITLIITLAMFALLIALFVGTLGGKYWRLLFPSLLVSFIIIPLILSIFYGSLLPLIVLYDWPQTAIHIPPQGGIFAGSIVGGLLGLKAGNIWEQDHDKSCLMCQLVPISLVLLISMVFLFFL